MREDEELHLFQTAVDALKTYSYIFVLVKLNSLFTQQTRSTLCRRMALGAI